MTEELFTDPETTHETWTDVRMTDPEEGEWDVDVVVVGGTVEYVDLRIRPELLTDFIDCLVDDVGTERAEAILSTVAERKDLDLERDDGGATGADRSNGTGDEGGTSE